MILNERANIALTNQEKFLLFKDSSNCITFNIKKIKLWLSLVSEPIILIFHLPVETRTLS